MCLMFHLRTKSDNQFVWWKRYTLLHQKLESWLRSRETVLIATEVPTLTTIDHNRIWIEKDWNRPIKSKPANNPSIENSKTLRSWRKRHGHKKVPSEWSWGQWASNRRSWHEKGCRLPTRDRHFLFSFNILLLWNGFHGCKPDYVSRRARRKELFFSINSSLWETNSTHRDCWEVTP